MGGQAALLGRMLGELGHEAIFSAIGQDWAASEWRGSLVLPAGAAIANLPTTPALVRNAGLVEPDLVLTLTDPWTLLGEELRELPLAALTNVAHDPLPLLITQAFAESHAIPVAITRWGQGVLPRPSSKTHCISPTPSTASCSGREIVPKLELRSESPSRRSW